MEEEKLQPTFGRRRRKTVNFILYFIPDGVGENTRRLATVTNMRFFLPRRRPMTDVNFHEGYTLLYITLCVCVCVDILESGLFDVGPKYTNSSETSYVHIIRTILRIILYRYTCAAPYFISFLFHLFFFYCFLFPEETNDNDRSFTRSEFSKTQFTILQERRILRFFFSRKYAHRIYSRIENLIYFKRLNFFFKSCFLRYYQIFI